MKRSGMKEKRYTNDKEKHNTYSSVTKIFFPPLSISRNKRYPVNAENHTMYLIGSQRGIK